MLLVNKSHPLASSYIPPLVLMDEKYAKSNHNKMHPLAYIHFKEMVLVALNDGITLYSVSAYRSFKDQDKIYQNYVQKDGEEKASKYSAKPGTSEHQTGLAVDINTCFTKDHFEKTKEAKWLSNNAYKYGFILRYPKDKEKITGYIYEPWHYRYVGIKASAFIHQNKITFEEYYDIMIKNKEV